MQITGEKAEKIGRTPRKRFTFEQRYDHTEETKLWHVHALDEAEATLRLLLRTGNNIKNKLLSTEESTWEKGGIEEISEEQSIEGQRTDWKSTPDERDISYSYYVDRFKAARLWVFPINVPASKPILTYDRGEVRADELKGDEHGFLWCKANDETTWRWHQVQRNYFFTIDFSKYPKVIKG